MHTTPIYDSPYPLAQTSKRGGDIGNVTLEVENTYDEFGRSNGSTYVLPNKTQEYGITYKENSNLISNYTYPAGMNAYSYGY